MSEKKKTRRGVVGLLLLLLAFGNGIFAQQVSQETAQSVAEAFFSQNVQNDRGKSVQFEDITAETSFQNFYIFSADSGFVFVAADERVTPILAYSTTSPFVTEDMPENLRGWLEGYDQQIQEVRDLALSSAPDISARWSYLKAGEPIPNKGDRGEELFMMTTKWDQNGSSCTLYNNACPETNSGQRCVTGCTATAIAQVLKYWNHPIQGVGNKTLTLEDMVLFYGSAKHPECYPISVDFSATTYDWQNMPNQLTCSSSQAEKDAIATLMLHCGVAMHTNYGLANQTDGGSSAPYLVDTISKYFDYSPCAFYAYQADYSDNEWKNKLKAEIDSHRPVLYRGSSSGGGHAFVFYGYDDNDLFLVNWGWSGRSDGYYAIGGLNPPVGGSGAGTTHDYNENNEAIFYLMPHDRTLSPPESFTVNNTSNYNELQLQWSPTLYAGSYVIMRNGAFLAETTSTSYLDDDITSGSYTYQVITVGENHRASLPSGSVTYTKPFTITTSAFPAGGGTTTGDGLYSLGDSCTVTATPNPGFAFLGWFNNFMGTILYSRQPEYTFTVTQNRHLCAKFVLANYNITTSCSPNNGGTVAGGGSYMAGANVTLTATPNSGYMFSCWTENGEVVSTQSTYSFQALSDRHLVANFMNLSFSIGDVITNPDGTKGVVFYINRTYTGGCMVALEDASTGCQWGNSGDVTFLRNYTWTRNECQLSDLDGYANTAVLRDYQPTNDNYAYGIVNYANGWYVPSAGQLRKLFGALPFIELSISSAGGTLLAENANYWSSTEHTESNAWTASFEMVSASKASNYRVRAVHDFSVNNTMRVVARTNDTELGSVTGTGFYANGATVTVTATPSGDNLFRGWTEAGHLVSLNPTYTFTANANRNLVANFAIRGGVGTLVTNPDGSQGVLFHLNEDGTEGWMVALEDASEGCQWGPDSDVSIMCDRAWNDQKVLRDQDGFYNTWLIRISQGTDNGYAASVVDFDNGWYLPSSGQLRKLFAELPLIEETILKAGGSLTSGTYWSSTEYSSSYVSTPGFEISYTSKTSNCKVRAIRNYHPAGDNVVLVAANDATMGTVSVSGSGVFALNESVTVNAIPNADYQFDHWTENGATVSYDASYQFTFTRSRSLVAHFVVPGSVGSVVTNADGSRGVVFYKEPSGNGCLIVALEDASEGCAWGVNEDILFLTNQNPGQSQYMLNDVNGYSNTQLIRQWQSNNPNYAAGKVDFDNGWYLPSAGELRKLYAALPLIEETIVSAGGTLLSGNSYWSSSECSSSQAWSPSFEFTKTSKSTNLRVRAIRGVSMPSTTIQAIALSAGANWVSFNVEVNLDDLKAGLVEAVPNTEITIQDQNNNVKYNPNSHRWTGRLTALDLSKMYKISVATQCELTLGGTPVNPALHPVTISYGANWIAYPLTGNMTPSNAFAGFAQGGDKLQSQTQNASYNGARWTGRLTTLEPGQGYIYQSSVSGDRIFTFPSSK